MLSIRAIYDHEPVFPATDQHPQAQRFNVAGKWVDAIGGEPVESDVVAILTPGPGGKDVDAERDRRLKQLSFNGHLFDFCDGKGSAENIAGAATLALAAMTLGAQPGNLRWANPNRDFAWIASDNTLVTMDAQTVLAFGMHAADTKAAHIYAARLIKDMGQIPADYTADSRWPA